MKRYGLYSTQTHDFLTHNGQVVYHDNAAELEFLVAGPIRVREVPPSIPEGQSLPLRFHPQMAAVTFPLTKEQFSRG